MSVVVSRRHREHRITIADTSWRNCRAFIRDAATRLLRSVQPCYALYTLAMTSLRPTRFCGDCAI